MSLVRTRSAWYLLLSNKYPRLSKALSFHGFSESGVRAAALPGVWLGLLMRLQMSVTAVSMGACWGSQLLQVHSLTGASPQAT